MVRLFYYNGQLDSKNSSKVDETKGTCPVLVVAGAEDRITTASVVSKVAAKIFTEP